VVYFDLANEDTGTTTALTAFGRITPASGGWYECVAVLNAESGATTPDVRLYVAEADADNVFDGLSQVSLYAWGASITPLSQAQTEAVDFGATYSGNWRADLSMYSGLRPGVDAIDVAFELSSNGVDWAIYTDESVVASARYGRIRATASGSEVLLQTADPLIRLDVVTREETGIAELTATGGYTVTLANSYQFAKSLQLTCAGTSSAGYVAIYDNIQVGAPTTFDIYVFDTAGNEAIRDVAWTWRGV
jgi:hypothetical protein